MLRFDCVVQTRPATPKQLPAQQLGSVTVQPLVAEVASEVLPWGVTFDQAADRLMALGRLYYEPDGSIVWTGNHPELGRWQMDGNLYDRGPELGYVQLVGRCPQANFEQLLTALGWPTVLLAFQLPKVGILLDYDDFLRVSRQ